MSVYKWFKHASGNGSDNPEMIKLINKVRVEGYGRFWLLIESIVRQQQHKAPKDDVVQGEFVETDLASILKIKKKKIHLFLEELSNLSIINWEVTDNGVRITMTNPQQFLTDRAMSSSVRPISGFPRAERREKKKIIL